LHKIYIDDREHAPILCQTLSDYGFQIEVKRLKIGDYVISPDTTIERKTSRDFCLSILDGRLFSQAYRLARYSVNPIIIIEGANGNPIIISEGANLTANHGIAIRPPAVKGALITLAQTFHLPILRTVDEADSAWYMHQLASQRKRVGQRQGPLSAYTPKSQQTKKEYVLRALPGIGTQTARKLLSQFGSVTNVINASEKELLNIHGMGKKTIERIHNVIKEEPARYAYSADAESASATKLHI